MLQFLDLKLRVTRRCEEAGTCREASTGML